MRLELASLLQPLLRLPPYIQNPHCLVEAFFVGQLTCICTLYVLSFENKFFFNSSSWQYSSYCWKSLFFLVNVTTFVSKMHLWHEPQSRPMDPWNICQIFSASASLFCKWLLFGRLDNSSHKKQDIGNLAMYLLGAQAVCGGTTNSHNSLAGPPQVGHQPGQTRWQSNYSICC